MEKNLYTDVKEYLNLQLEKIKLDTTEKVSIMLGKIIWLFIVAIFAMIITLFLLLLLYIYLEYLLGAKHLALLVELAIVGIISFIVYKLRFKLIINPTANVVIKTLNQDDEEENTCNLK